MGLVLACYDRNPSPDWWAFVGVWTPVHTKWRKWILVSSSWVGLTSLLFLWVSLSLPLLLYLLVELSCHNPFFASVPPSISVMSPISNNPPSPFLGDRVFVMWIVRSSRRRLGSANPWSPIWMIDPGYPLIPHDLNPRRWPVGSTEAPPSPSRLVCTCL